MFIRIFCFPFCISRSDLKNDIGKLTTTTGLFLQCLTVLNSCIECFFISHLWRTLVYFYFKLTLIRSTMISRCNSPIPLKNGLTCFFICFYTQCRIFFHQFGNSHTHFINVGLCFWLNCNRDYRLRNEHIFQSDRMIFITKVSPVLISLKPTAAPISPASIKSIGFCLLANIFMIRLIRSFLPLLTFNT